MLKPAFTLCVYCGSRPGADPAFAEAAKATGRWIAKHNGQLVYGGGRAGLMGLVADSVLDNGGSVIGVIPRALEDKELAHRGCTELHVVETMHERKRIMAERADAFLALPGGIGTLEEFFEIWTWRQLGYHDKPVGILNTHGFYDGLKDFLSNTVKNGFVSPKQLDLVTWGSDLNPLLETLVQSAGLSPEANLQQV